LNFLDRFSKNPQLSSLMNIRPWRTKVMRISRQTFPTKIMIDQKQQENVESIKYLGSMLTNDERCTCEMKSRTAIAKAAFNKKRSLFSSTLDLKLRNKLVKCDIWCWNLDDSGSRSETPGKFWNVVLKKDGDQLDRSSAKRSIT